MVSNFFLGIALVGAEWVLYLLILLSVISFAVILERVAFYRKATQGLQSFRAEVRKSAEDGNWDRIAASARERVNERSDLETEMALALVQHKRKAPSEILTEVAQDSVERRRLSWERNLAVLATIGSNAPFVGLFGTVLGIIKAFRDLSAQSASGAQAVSSGISEALVATAVGLLVAIPAVVAFNLFSRKVRTAVGEAESLKSFLIGKLAE
jgi:biopolymer transport protein ExbB